MKTTAKLWILIIILAILTPVGLVMPGYFRSGPAWGEWSADELAKMAGYMPDKLARLGLLWSAPLPDYAFKGGDNASPAKMSLAYAASAVIGIAVIAGIFYLGGRLISRK